MVRRVFNKGVTLIEVLVSMSLLGIVMAMLPIFFLTQLQFNTKAEEKTAAISAAQAVLDGYRIQDPSTLPKSGTLSPLTINVGNYQFLAYVSFCSVPAYCKSLNNRQIKVEVERDGEQLYSVDTVYTKLR